MLVHDLTEVIEGIASITGATIGIAEAASWIAHVGRVCSIASWHGDPAQAYRIECKEDVASSQVGGSCIDLCWIRLIEHIEQAGSELNLLFFSDVEILEK